MRFHNLIGVFQILITEIVFSSEPALLIIKIWSPFFTNLFFANRRLVCATWSFRSIVSTKNVMDSPYEGQLRTYFAIWCDCNNWYVAAVFGRMLRGKTGVCDGDNEFRANVQS